MHTGPVIIGFDGTPAAERAIHEAADLLAARGAQPPRDALVVFVWDAGSAFEAVTLPEQALEFVSVDVSTALKAEKAASEDAQQLAERGAALARDAGFRAEGQAVAHDLTVAETLVKLAREVDAQAVVVGLREHHGLARLAPGKTLPGLLHTAPCPVVACGAANPS